LQKARRTVHPMRRKPRYRPMKCREAVRRLFHNLGFELALAEEIGEQAAVREAPHVHGAADHGIALTELRGASAPDKRHDL
jgi:hypothetical protein